MVELQDIMNIPIGGDLVSEYVFAAGITIFLAIVFRVFKFLIIARLRQLSEKTPTKLDDLVIDVIDNVRWPFYVMLAAWVGMQFVTLPPIITTITSYLVLGFAGYYFVKGLTEVINYAAKQYIARREKEDKGADTSVVDLLANILKLVVWVFAIALVLANAGVDITPVIAGLGIGGVAIAFALQGILKDVFAAFSIFFDKPFRKGDFIVIGNDSGTVEKIGIKSTRLKTLQGQQLIVSNQEITETRVHNYRKMQKRRVEFTFGVTYETPLAKLKKIPGIVQNVFSRLEHAELDRVHFKKFADFSLNFEVVYHVDTREYNIHMDVQQEMNFRLKEAMEKEKIEFAYPTQLVYYKKPA